MFRHRLMHVSMVFALSAVAFAPALSTASAAAPVTLTLATGKGDIPTADPGLTTDSASSQLTTVTHTPLIRPNDEELSKIVPALAEKWEMSDGGKTVTFHIRKDVPWVKWDKATSKVIEVMDASGKPAMVNAHDFEYAIKRVLDPRTASGYAYAF